MRTTRAVWGSLGLAALEDTGFPEELVANTSLEKYERLLEESRRA